MKKFKPYLCLSKKDDSYELSFAVCCKSDQTIESIVQHKVEYNKKDYWGVIVTLSNQTQLVNSPQNPIYSSVVKIDPKNSLDFSTIKCIVMQSSIDDLLQPTQTEASDIDFSDS